MQNADQVVRTHVRCPWAGVELAREEWEQMRSEQKRVPCQMTEGLRGHRQGSEWYSEQVGSKLRALNRGLTSLETEQESKSRS